MQVCELVQTTFGEEVAQVQESADSPARERERDLAHDATRKEVRARVYGERSVSSSSMKRATA